MMAGRIMIYLKMNIMRWQTWAFLALFATMVITVRGISIPDGTENRILLYSEGTGSGERILDRIMEDESSFIYERAESSETVREEVLKGLAECGFIFPEDLDERLEAGDLSGSIEYVYSPFTVKGNVAKETVFAAVYPEYAPVKADEAAEDLYGEYPEGGGSSDSPSEKARQIYDSYLQSGRLFHIRYVEESAGGEETADPAGGYDTWPVHGVCAVIFFIYLFFASGSHRLMKEGPGGTGDRMAYIIGAALMPAMLSLIFILCLERRLHPGAEICAFMVYMICAEALALLLTAVIKRRESIMGWTAVFAAAGLLVTPVFWNTMPYGSIIPSGMYIHILSLLM